jgi:hypothetical protein
VNCFNRLRNVGSPIKKEGLAFGVANPSSYFAFLVPEVGIEPTRIKDPLDFESSASTNFTTPALGFVWNYSENF